MYVLGINAFHGDSSAALIRHGRFLAAAEEERFQRVKHWAGFPSQAIAYCLREAGTPLSEVDCIALNQDNRANLARKLTYLFRRQPSPALVVHRLQNRSRRQGVPELLANRFPGQEFRGKILNVEHHVCHLYSAFYVSPFPEAAIVSVDGFGDFASTAWGAGKGDEITLDGRVYYPHSLGVFYQALTQFLGFPYYGDEFKVMGLAPYGKPTYLNAMRQIVKLKSDGRFQLNLDYFRHHAEYVPYQWEEGRPEVGDLFSPALEELLGPRRQPDEPLEQRHNDIARSVQAMYEEAFFNLLTALHERTGLTNLALAGGCAANSVANGKVRRMTPFQHVYVQPAAGDAGGAIGAAYAVWHKLNGGRFFVMSHAFWGPQFGQPEIAALVEARAEEIRLAGCTVREMTDEEELSRWTATEIAAGRVVGWFQGRMEWGPRALGHRSILGDPRRAEMKAILNAKIKHREAFRPFSPSVLSGSVSEWFEEDDAEPFMMQVFQVREDKRPLIPAVTHIDGSARLQTVYQHSNKQFYRLIEAFRDITGVPMVLNTSFNEREPVVCNPEEALDCFLRTKMDVLVLGNTMITRGEGPTNEPPSSVLFRNSKEI